MFKEGGTSAGDGEKLGVVLGQGCMNLGKVLDRQGSALLAGSDVLAACCCDLP